VAVLRIRGICATILRTLLCLEPFIRQLLQRNAVSVAVSDAACVAVSVAVSVAVVRIQHGRVTVLRPLRPKESNIYRKYRPPAPMNHVKIFKGWPSRDAPWELVQLWYTTFLPDHDGQVEMKDPTRLSNKTSTA